MKKYYIRLDIQKPYDTEYIQVIQQDTLANTLYVTLLNSGELIPMNELTFIEVVADKPDATQWISSAEVVSDGQVKVDLDYQAITAMGIVNISIKLYVADSVVSTYPFQVRVIADPHAGTDGSVVSTSEYPILTGLINDVQAAGEVSGNMLVWEVYDPLKTYAEGNKVSYNGSSYYCKAATTGSLPTNTLFWILIAAKGDTGEQGIQGIQGEQGIQGIQGETGEPGATWISGTGAPTTEGVDGDFYFNSVAYDMYKKTLGAWGLIANVKGIQGIQGVQGVSISSITRTAGTGAPGTLDTYTITYSDTTTSTFQVYNGADGEGAGDMTAAVYDTDGDGKVNAAVNADTVNNLTVETAVPTGAVFTDTVYEHPATHSADIITDGTTNKAYTAIEKTKLTAIEAGAEVNDPIANNLTTTITGSVLDATQGKAINDSLVAHQAEKVHQVEAHGLRATNGKLEYFDGTNYKTVSGGLPVGNVVAFEVDAGNAQTTITWADPIDVTLDGATLAAWKGTKILRKTTGYPANKNDGTLVIDSGIRDQYITNGFVDTGLTNDTLYYYSAFPYTYEDIYDKKADAQAAPQASVVYGVKIDTTNTNPATAVTYTDMAVGFTPASGNNGAFDYGSWADKFPFNQIRPCLYKDGAVNYYLNPNDYTKKEDGVTASDITTGADGDVMVEFPKIWWKLETVGTDLFVRYSDTQHDVDYKPLAHTKGTTEKDFVYISAYLGYTLSTKLRSLSGKTPTVTKTIGAFRTDAQANGTEFEQMAYYQLLMTQILYLVMFKNRDSQTALGRGFVDGNTAAINTGGTNLKGMFYGETTGKLQMKFCGIEDWYGNLRYWIDGFFSNATWNILIATENFNDTGSGYIDFGQGATANVAGYISGVQGGTETGFVIKTSTGSATTHYPDGGYLYASRLPYFGGYWADADSAGAFLLDVSDSAAYSNSGIGARSRAL